MSWEQDLLIEYSEFLCFLGLLRFWYFIYYVLVIDLQHSKLLESWSWMLDQCWHITVINMVTLQIYGKKWISCCKHLFFTYFIGTVDFLHTLSKGFFNTFYISHVPYESILSTWEKTSLESFRSALKGKYGLEM